MMENSFEDDDLEGDLNRFCEDMDRELDEISGTAKKEPDPKPEFPTPLKRPEEVKKENEKSKPETTVAASPWGMSLFSSFASSATKSMSASFSPLAKDLTSITSLATSATKAFSDTLTGSPYGTPEQKQSNGSGLNDLTSLARTPEALAKLQKIQAEQDLKRSQMTYACLIASRSAREIAVPARSVTEIPVLVPPGKDISWKFQVKHYDILFGVKLRVQQDGSGEWTEHELVPVGMITSDDHIDEGCCSERCARKFIFSLDNNIAMIYSKTVAFDIILTDDDECWREDPEVDEALENNCDNSQDMEHTDVVAENLFGDDCISSDVLPDVDFASAKCIDESVTTGNMEEWTVFHNDDGQPYYYNNYTQECQWEKPDGVETSWSESDTNPTSQDVPQVEDAGDDDDMAALMLKLSRGFKAGHITAEQRQKFMEDIIECRDLGEVHRELNEIFDQSDGSPQKSIPTVV